MTADVPHRPADAASAPLVLVVGGSPVVQLAWCRLLGVAGHRVGLLRWQAHRSAADFSRYCQRSFWLGDVDAGVGRWRAALGALLREGAVGALLPADALALALVCDGVLALPAGVLMLGKANIPARPHQAG